MSRDHVHIYTNVPAHLASAQIMQWVKGRSSRRLQQEFEELRRRYWGQHLWARGYFCASAGTVTDEMISGIVPILVEIAQAPIVTFDTRNRQEASYR